MREDNSFPLGNEWPLSSLIWGTRGGSGDVVECRSPADGSRIQQTRLLDAREMELLLQSPPRLLVMPRDELWLFTARLLEELQAMSQPLWEARQRETAFIRADCDDKIAGVLDYVRGFQKAIEQAESAPPAPVVYGAGTQTRHIRLERCPWGTVAVVLPQNAFLLVALTCLLNGLATGNRVLLRAPLQAVRSAALLALAIERAAPPLQSVSLVMVRARPFMEALYRSPLPCLVHYMGSSGHAAAILPESFGAGKPTIIDGTGNTWVWLSDSADVGDAARILTAGALRFNGQTCTAINGVMIHPRLYPALREHLRDQWGSMKAGDPLSDEVRVGPLFDTAQATWCEEQIAGSGGTVLCGGRREENLLHPTLVENPNPQSALVSEGLFGPAMWLCAGERDDFVALWQRNRYPLCAGVLTAPNNSDQESSDDSSATWWVSRLPNLARLVINGDPSAEHIFEPWGAYPQSGTNTVGAWHEKYQRVLSVDEPR